MIEIMETNNENFRKLIEAAVAVTREGAELAGGCKDFSYAMNLVASKKARLELRIGFNPAPHAIGEIINDETGEVIGHLFQIQGRSVTVN